MDYLTFLDSRYLSMSDILNKTLRPSLIYGISFIKRPRVARDMRIYFAASSFVKSLSSFISINHFIFLWKKKQFYS